LHWEELHPECVENAACWNSEFREEFIQECEKDGCSDTLCKTFACTSNIAAPCANNLTLCMSESTTLSGMCSCLGPYSTCLRNMGCWEQYQENFAELCSGTGCPASQCEADECDQVAAAQCATNNSLCISNATDESQICSCVEFLPSCMENAGCWDDQEINNFVEYCEGLGCGAANCKAAIGCNATAVIQCVNNATQCIEHATDQTVVCDCMKPYAICLENTGCWTKISHVFEQACEEVGCTVAQCTPNSIGTLMNYSK